MEIVSSGGLSRAVSLWDMLFVIATSASAGGAWAAVRASGVGQVEFAAVVLASSICAIAGVVLRKRLMLWALRSSRAGETHVRASRRYRMAFALALAWIPLATVLGFGATRLAMWYVLP